MLKNVLAQFRPKLLWITLMARALVVLHIGGAGPSGGTTRARVDMSKNHIFNISSESSGPILTKPILGSTEIPAGGMVSNLKKYFPLKSKAITAFRIISTGTRGVV